jgi:hypothetical protein
MSVARQSPTPGPGQQSFQALANAYGVQPRTQQGGAQMGSPFDPGGTDFPIYNGPPQVRESRVSLPPDQMRASPSFINYRRNVSETIPNMTSVGQERVRLFQMTPAERSAAQQAMFIGGYFGNREPSSIRWGEPDDATVAAWDDVLVRAARETAAGNNVTVQDLLRRMASGPNYGNQEETGRGPGGGGGSVASVISPESATELANNVASAVLGRRATVEEQRLIHAAVRDAQVRYQQSRGGEIPAPEAIAADMLRDRNPNEAAGVDLASTYGAFVQMLDGIGM